MTDHIRDTLVFRDGNNSYEHNGRRSQDGTEVGINPLDVIRASGLPQRKAMVELKRSGHVVKYSGNGNEGISYLVGQPGLDFLVRLIRREVKQSAYRDRYIAFLGTVVVRYFRGEPAELPDLPAEIDVHPVAIPGEPLSTSPFDKIRHFDENNIEYWLGRELGPNQGYPYFHKFEPLIKEAMEICKSNGHNLSEHFNLVVNPSVGGNGAVQNVRDWKLSRHACYLIATCGDGRKPEVAASKQYFVMQTRRKELSDVQGHGSFDIASVVAAAVDAALSRVLPVLDARLEAKIRSIEQKPRQPPKHSEPLREIPANHDRLGEFAKKRGHILSDEERREEGIKCARLIRREMSRPRHVFQQHVYNDNDVPANIYPNWGLNLWYGGFLRERESLLPFKSFAK